MPRTKYIAFFFAVVIAVLLVVLLHNALNDSRNTFSLAPTQRALAVESVSGRMPDVIVAMDTVREETRRALIEKLRHFTPAVESTRTEPKEETTALPPETPRIQAASAPLYCTDGSESGSGIAAWGPVSVTRAEGARILTSHAIADDGSPLRSLQLTDHPVVATQGSCLPRGMIGLALDGRVIEAGTPFMTSAEGVAGYALDGFAIYGPFENGAPVSSDELDTCHGHVHPIVWNDTPTSMYHYHVTNDAAPTLGCFRGTTAPLD